MPGLINDMDHWSTVGEHGVRLHAIVDPRLLRTYRQLKPSISGCNFFAEFAVVFHFL